jgi:hypothetical protein
MADTRLSSLIAWVRTNDTERIETERKRERKREKEV